MIPDGFNGADLKPIVIDIIQKAESVGLKVHCLASDMGPVNQALWRSFHACSAGRYADIVNSTVHPCDENRKLWFLPDPGHLLKNLKSGLLSNETITLPENFCKT